MTIITRKHLDPKFFSSITDYAKYNYLANARLQKINNNTLKNGLLPIRDNIKPKSDTVTYSLIIHAATFKAAYGLDNLVLAYNRYQYKDAPFVATYVGIKMVSDTKLYINTYMSINDVKVGKAMGSIIADIHTDGFFYPSLTNNCIEEFNTAGIWMKGAN